MVTPFTLAPATQATAATGARTTALSPKPTVPAILETIGRPTRGCAEVNFNRSFDELVRWWAYVLLGAEFLPCSQSGQERRYSAVIALLPTKALIPLPFPNSVH